MKRKGVPFLISSFVASNKAISVRFLILVLQQLRLRRRQSCDGHARAGAGDVVEADVVAEADGAGVAAVFAADADFQFRVGRATFAYRHLHQLSHALDVEYFERVIFEDAGLGVGGQELVLGIFAAEREGGLGEVIGAEGEELGGLGHASGAHAGTHHF